MIYLLIIIIATALALLKTKPAIDKTEQGDIIVWYTPILGEKRKFIKF